MFNYLLQIALSVYNSWIKTVTNEIKPLALLLRVALLFILYCGRSVCIPFLPHLAPVYTYTDSIVCIRRHFVAVKKLYASTRIRICCVFDRQHSIFDTKMFESLIVKTTISWQRSTLEASIIRIQIRLYPHTFYYGYALRPHVSDENPHVAANV